MYQKSVFQSHRNHNVRDVNFFLMIAAMKSEKAAKILIAKLIFFAALCFVVASFWLRFFSVKIYNSFFSISCLPISFAQHTKYIFTAREEEKKTFPKTKKNLNKHKSRVNGIIYLAYIQFYLCYETENRASRSEEKI